MLEKLTEHYRWCIQQGNGGHVVVYDREIAERIQSEYHFPLGKFSLKEKTEQFFLWHYNPTPSED